MANVTPEKNKKASALSDDELFGVSGGVEQLRRGRTEKPSEVDDEDLDGVSGGYETLRRGPSSGKSSEVDDEDLDGVSGGVTVLKPIMTDTAGEVDDGSDSGNGLASASVTPT